MPKKKQYGGSNVRRGTRFKIKKKRCKDKMECCGIVRVFVTLLSILFVQETISEQRLDVIAFLETGRYNFFLKKTPHLRVGFVWFC
jgi:hypothetical protein